MARCLIGSLMNRSGACCVGVGPLVGGLVVCVTVLAFGLFAGRDGTDAPSTRGVAMAQSSGAAIQDAGKDGTEDSKASQAEAKEKVVDAYVLGHTMSDIDGKSVDLASYKGKVILMVNVASRCGFTPQYEGLEKLYQSKKDAGLVVLGFPANNFMGQEPGTNLEIKEFCQSKYGVTFPMFEKISVKGEDIHPLYKQLTAQPAPVGGEVGWNFTKYLVDREGKVVARFDSRVRPDDAAMAKRIDELLGPSQPASPAGK